MIRPLMISDQTTKRSDKNEQEYQINRCSYVYRNAWSHNIFPIIQPVIFFFF